MEVVLVTSLASENVPFSEPVHLVVHTVLANREQLVFTELLELVQFFHGFSNALGGALCVQHPLVPGYY